MLELNNLEYAGKGVLVDKETGVRGDIYLSTPLEYCQVVFSLDQEVTDEGNLVPRLVISDVQFQLPSEGFDVIIDADLPVRKSGPIREEFKKSVGERVSVLEGDFKKALEKAEKEVMSSFRHKKKISLNSYATSSLSEAMNLKGDHMVLEWLTEYEGTDLSSYSKNMRSVKPDFSEDDALQKDVQVVIDENYMNYIMFSNFYSDDMFSINELLLNMFPDEFTGASYAVQAIMNTKVVGMVFPELIKEYGSFKKLDMRCGTNKNYLHQAELEEEKVSHVRFKKGNRVEADLHFGCGIYVFSEESSSDDMMHSITNLFKQLDTDLSDERWSQFRSFFASVSIDAEIDVASKPTKMKHPLDHIVEIDMADMTSKPPFAAGRIKDLKPKIHELKVLKKDGKVSRDEAKSVQKKLDELFSGEASNPLASTTFGQSIPLSPFPEVARCLGLHPDDSTIQFEEGYVVVGFDYSVSSAE